MNIGISGGFNVGIFVGVTINDGRILEAETSGNDWNFEERYVGYIGLRD